MPLAELQHYVVTGKQSTEMELTVLHSVSSFCWLSIALLPSSNLLHELDKTYYVL